MHDPIEQTSNHAKACAERLRRLPPEALPPYNWQEFLRRSQRSLRRLEAARPEGPQSGATRRESRHSLDWRHMAAAAALLLIVCGTAVWGRWDRGTYDSMSEDPSSLSVANEGDPDDGRSAPNVASVAVLRSRAIESWLATLPREPVVVHVGTRAAVAQLEDRIAQVDDLLTSVRLEGMRPDGLAALQQERVRLVGSLAQVRYAEVVAAESP